MTNDQDQRQPSRLAVMFSDHRSKWQFGLSALVAAALAFVLYKKPFATDTSFKVNAGASVAVYYEQGGELTTWKPGTTLNEGTKIHAEVLAVKPAVAFWGITANGGRLLSDPQQVLANRLQLAAGEKKLFSNNFELSGPGEGETLVIAICPADYVEVEAPETPELLAKLLLYFSTDTLVECKTQRFALR